MIVITKIKSHNKIPIDKNANANANDEDGDPYITRIKNTGCFNQHELLQDCFWVKKDWRKCKNEMEQFKKCMNPSI